MTPNQIKDKGWIIYSVRTGSHAYGTNFPGSDYDEKGVYIQPTEDILKGNYIPFVKDEDNDIFYYEVGYFIELLIEGNPNLAELLNMPKDTELYVDYRWDLYFPKKTLNKFITGAFKDRFSGFAMSQLKKSKGRNKKINWEKSRFTRKDPLDFCYVLMEREESILFRDWLAGGSFIDSCDILDGLTQEDIALAKVNNVPDLYSMYYYPQGRGMIGEDSNQLRLENIPKSSLFLGYVRFNQNGYSSHCKEYREYSKWLEDRNELRHIHNIEHGQDYDSKSLLHTVRLLSMGEEIASGKGVIVRRPDAEYLKSIRLGEVDLEELHGECEQRIKNLKNLLDQNVPTSIDKTFIENLLFRIRIANLENMN